MKNISPGAACTINTVGDIAVYAEKRPFIGKRCVILKRTKAGLILVALESDMKKTETFPQRNVDVIQG